MVLEVTIYLNLKKNTVEIFGLPYIFTEDHLTEKVVELCNDVVVVVESIDSRDSV